MLDLNFIRENPDKVKAALVDLNTEAPIDEILELDQQRRSLLKEVEVLRQERNVGSKAIGQLMREGKKEEAEAQKKRMSDIGDQISQLDEQLRQVETTLYDKQLYVPNMPGPGVPVGPDESLFEQCEKERERQPPGEGGGELPAQEISPSDVCPLTAEAIFSSTFLCAGCFLE